jgi:hypothetical protein
MISTSFQFFPAMDLHFARIIFCNSAGISLRGGRGLAFSFFLICRKFISAGEKFQAILANISDF